MNYGININQRKLADTSLDLHGAAILDYLYKICASTKTKIEDKRITFSEQRWTWVDYGHLIKQMPLLRFKSAGSITPRIKAIAREGFIETHQSEDRRLYVRMLPRMDTLIGDDNDDEEVPDRTDLFTQVNSPIHVAEQPPVHVAEHISVLSNNQDTRITTNVGDDDAPQDADHPKKKLKAPREQNPDGSYGNPDVSALKAYFLERLGLEGTDDDPKKINHTAWNLLRKKSTDARPALVRLKEMIDAAAEDPFWAGKLTSLQTLYGRFYVFQNLAKKQSGGDVDPPHSPDRPYIAKNPYQFRTED